MAFEFPKSKDLINKSEDTIQQAGLTQARHIATSSKRKCNKFPECYSDSAMKFSNMKIGKVAMQKTKNKQSGDKENAGMTRQKKYAFHETKIRRLFANTW